MRKLFLSVIVIAVFGAYSVSGYSKNHTNVISEQEAVRIALAELGVEVLGIRFDKPDKQWDVFIKSGDQAYEVEVDAFTRKVVGVEAESIEEVKAELSGDLSHEGVEGDVDK